MDLPEKNNEIYFKGLISMMEHLSEPWGIKDRQSRHIYMNKAAYLYTNTPLDFDIEGKLDNEFPAHWAEFSPEFIEHDKRTEESQDRVTVIETHYWYGKDFLMPFISEKLPIYNDKKELIEMIYKQTIISNKEEDINEIFERIIYEEIKDLEKDIQPFS